MSQAQEPYIPEGLRLVSGRPYKVIKQLLESRQIEHNVATEPSRGGGLFSEGIIFSIILVDEWMRPGIEKVLGKPDYISKATAFPPFSYDAEYEIGPGFDIGQLSGLLRFRGGRLVEETVISFEPRYNATSLERLRTL